jgi:hypothetical protein
MNTGRESDYQAYLLRLWPVEANGRSYWRASIQNVSTGERHGFADLEALFAFLREAARLPDERPEQG